MAYSQDFKTNSSASYMGGGCYQLTPDSTNVFGSIWNYNQIDLSKPFDFAFTMNFGTKDLWGADGSVFVIHNDPNGLNTTGFHGYALGAGFITPMLGIEFDIYDNQAQTNETGLDDHIAIFQNGNNDHGSADMLSPAVEVGNIETGNYIDYRITWDPTTQNISVYMNCILVLQLNHDIINNIFSGDTLVYWGFTGDTGGMSTYQNVCGLQTLPDTVEICLGDTIQLDASFYSGGIVWTPSTNIDNAFSSTPKFNSLLS